MSWHTGKMPGIPDYQSSPGKIEKRECLQEGLMQKTKDFSHVPNRRVTNTQRTDEVFIEFEYKFSH